MVYLPHWPIPATLGNKKINYETVFARMLPVLQKLGNPHQKLPPVIHIAGTNGKGSISALLAKIFAVAGYKASVYTSPHLLHCNERIVLNSQIISNSRLYEVLEETRLASQDHQFTFMESFTIASFLAFSQSNSDILIVECGMGGRIDATNIIENKLATIISAISLDHQEYLGNTLTEIALQKACIARKNTPLIVAKQDDFAINFAINQVATKLQSITYFYQQDFSLDINTDGSFDFYWQDENLLPNLPQPNLFGKHQYFNFATALACIMAISRDFYFTYQHLAQAIVTVFWPARLQKLNNHWLKLLPQNSQLFFDGAHNVGGALALADWLACQTNFNNTQKFVICGFSKNKCRPDFLLALQKFNLLAVTVGKEPYPESSKIIAEIGKKHNLAITDANNLFDALNLISQQNQPCLVVICGSLHFALELL